MGGRIMNIALVAHDGRKKEMVEWITYNIDTLKEHTLYATNRTTADMILTSPLFDNKDYNRIIPKVIDDYKNRKL